MTEHKAFDRHTWYREARRYAKHIWCYEDLIDDHEASTTASFEAGVDPYDYVENLGNEYDLDRCDTSWGINSDKRFTKRKPSPLFFESQVMTSLIVWETMVLQQSMKQAPGSCWEKMAHRWEDEGVNEMRDAAITLAGWVDTAFEQLENKFGDEPLLALGMDAFDFEFVPVMLEMVTWDTPMIATPTAEEAVAVLIAKAAMSEKQQGHG